MLAFKASVYARTLYNAVYIYLNVLNKTLAKGGTIEELRNGTLIASSAEGTYQGGKVMLNKTRKVVIRLKRERLNNWTVGDNYLISIKEWARQLRLTVMALGIPHFQFGRTVQIKLRPFIWLCKSSTCSPTTTFNFTFILILFEGNIFKKLYLNYTNANTSIWASRNGSQPLNEPLCGYTGKKCPLDFTGLFIGGGSIISVLLIVSIAAVAYAIWYNNFLSFLFFYLEKF